MTQQQAVPLPKGGRAAGTSLFIARDAELLGCLVGAVVAATLGLAATLAIGGVGALLAVAVLVAFPPSKRLSADDDKRAG
jgi:hypothetical protein